MYNIPMRITILTYGSRGDVQPFLALALGLMEAGHHVRLAAPARFRELVESHQVEFFSLVGDPEELSKRLNNAGYNFIRTGLELLKHAIDIGAEMFGQMEEACQDAELIVHSFAHAFEGHALAREKQIPDVHVQTFPLFSATGDYPNVTFPDLKFPSLNRLSHNLSQTFTWWSSKFGFEQVQCRGALTNHKLYWPFAADRQRPSTPILCEWSPTILPASNDWPLNVHLTGYFFLPVEKAFEPPSALAEFLQAGIPPICITFGSMVNRSAEKIYNVIRETLKQTGQRGVILSGWGGSCSSDDENIFYLEAAPHAWLLPRCELVIHHGGAGTTATGLRAGIPGIVVPFTADQPFWGRRVASIGAGPDPILVKDLSAPKLVAAIQVARSAAMKSRAQTIGQEISMQSGVGTAVKLIEQHVNKFYK